MGFSGRLDTVDSYRDYFETNGLDERYATLAHRPAREDIVLLRLNRKPGVTTADGKAEAQRRYPGIKLGQYRHSHRFWTWEVMKAEAAKYGITELTA